MRRSAKPTKYDPFIKDVQFFDCNPNYAHTWSTDRWGNEVAPSRQISEPSVTGHSETNEAPSSTIEH